MCKNFYFFVRFILDDSALYLSDKCESDTVDLKRGKMDSTLLCAVFFASP